MRTILPALALFLFSLVLPVSCGAWCLQPSENPPRCTDQVENRQFQSDEEYAACRADVERYVKRMREWAACVHQESVMRSNEAIEKFNCKVRGEYCP